MTTSVKFFVYSVATVLLTVVLTACATSPY